MGNLASMLVVLFLAAVPCAGQWLRTPGPVGGPVNVLVTRPSDGAIFAGTAGGVARSTDGGATWIVATDSIPPTLSVSGIAFSGSTVYACGTSPVSGGAIYKSTDDGDSWTTAAGTGLTTGVFAIMNDVAVSGPNVVVALYSLLGGASVFASTDGGATWAASATGLPAGYQAYRLFVTGSQLYTGSSTSSTVHGPYLSTDNGASWSTAAVGFPTTSFELAFASIGSTVFCATNAAGVWRTTNSGGAWTRISPTTPVLILGGNSMAASGSNLFIGGGGRVWKADANGDNWVQVITGLPATNAGSFTPALTRSGSSMVAAISKLGLYRSGDDGANWAASNDGLALVKVQSLYHTGSSVYAGTATMGFAMTSDAGASWPAINNGIDLVNDNAYYGFAEAGGYLIAGAGGPGVVRSSDGGANWVSATGTGPAPAYTVIAEGGEAFMGTLGDGRRSTDGGDTWTSLAIGYPGYAVVFALWKDGTDMLAGSNGGVKRSTDGGATWTAPISGLPGIGGPHAFLMVGTTLVHGHDGGVYVSTDRGATWTASSTGMPFPNAVNALVEAGGRIYAGTRNGVWKSTDTGATWVAANEGFPPAIIVNALAHDGTYLYAGTDFQSAWRRPLSELTDVREPAATLPTEAALRQNYPNPFNPATTIRYQVPNGGRVSLTVFNALGERVATLVEGFREPGYYVAEWDAAGFPSGVYFAELRAGSLTATRKMLLTK